MLKMTYSMVKKLNDCERACYLRYVLGAFFRVEEEKKAAMYKGSLFHSFMANGFRGVDAVEIDPPQTEHTGSAIAAYRAYREFYNQNAFPSDVMPEQNFELRLGRGARARVTGMIDGLSPTEIWEHKSARTIHFDYDSRLALDLQTLIYSLGTGRREVVYNVVRMPALKWNTEKQSFAEYVERSKQNLLDSPEKSFYRINLSIPAYRLTTGYAYLKKMASRVSRMSKKSWLDCDLNYNSCFPYNGSPCAYTKICESNDPEFALNNFYEITPEKIWRELEKGNEAKNGTTENSE